MVNKLSDNAALATCNGAVDAIDTGSGTAKLNIYGGTRPANPATAAGSSPLVSFDLPNPCFGNAAMVSSNAKASANAITPVNASAGGTATWARVLDRNGNAYNDVDVTDTSGSGEVKLSSTTVVNGTETSVVSWDITVPRGW